MPHNGCPRQCSFCDQHRITGQQKQPTAEEVTALLKQSAARMPMEQRQNTQLAFFGGSFTAIDRNYMLSLLQAGAKGVEQYGFHSIRCSTRPDCVEDGVLDLLQSYHVQSVELGAQSMADSVLVQNDRGHTAKDVEDAAGRIHAHGMELGLQMMTGLYTDTDAGAVFTAKEFIRLRADTVRIYPTVVLEHTKLYELYQQGLYRPQTVEEAVALCARLLSLFEEADIPVIRCGLHSSDGLTDGKAIGPFHPAFGQLCLSRMLYEKIRQRLGGYPHGAYTVHVSPQSLSDACGQHRENLILLEKDGYSVSFSADSTLKRGEVSL